MEYSPYAGSDMGAAFRKKKRREHKRTSYAVPPPEGVTPDDVSPGGDTTGLVARCWAPCKKCGGEIDYSPADFHRKIQCGDCEGRRGD